VADAVERFKVLAEERARQETERKAEQDRLGAKQRKSDMIRLADEFENVVGEIVNTVSTASTQLEASAGTLSSSATRAQELTTTVAAASEQASANVQSVATASEELSAAVKYRIRRASQARPSIRREPRPTALASCRKPLPGSATSST
jgi:methyl-accepting chemotaxis protein